MKDATVLTNNMRSCLSPSLRISPCMHTACDQNVNGLRHDMMAPSSHQPRQHPLTASSAHARVFAFAPEYGVCSPLLDRGTHTSFDKGGRQDDNMDNVRTAHQVVLFFFPRARALHRPPCFGPQQHHQHNKKAAAQYVRPDDVPCDSTGNRQGASSVRGLRPRWKAQEAHTGSLTCEHLPARGKSKGHHVKKIECASEHPK